MPFRRPRAWGKAVVTGVEHLPSVILRQRGPTVEAISVPRVAWFSAEVFKPPEARTIFSVVYDAAKQIITLNVANGPIRYGIPSPRVEKDGSVMAVLLDVVDA